jgi:MarR family 2-MHQ and catechol resistance regulon transcriptional repressor
MAAGEPSRARPDRALSAYVKLLRSVKSVLARVEPRIHAAGLTMTQFGVLECLYHKGPMTPRELSRKVLTSAGNMTDVLDKLEARDLLQRSRGEADRRRVLVSPSEEGKALIAGLFPLHATDITGAMSGLADGELALLDDLLRKLGMAAASAMRESGSCPNEEC